MLSNIQNPKSICILRLSAIGDVCHAVASVQAIQERWPESHITWVIGKIEFQLLKGLPGVEFILFDKKTGFKGYMEFRAKLKNRRFDVLLHMQVAFRASLATLFIRAEEKWGFDKKRAKEAQWLFTNRKIKSQNEPHVASGFMEFAKAVGVPGQVELSWEMPLEPSHHDCQRNHLAEVGQYIVIAAAASKQERNWLPERYAAFADHAHNNGYSVVLCGGPVETERELAHQIGKLCKFEPLNLVGKTSLKQLLAVIKEADLVLAPDTGPVHMAVTVNTPVIGLYAHSNPKRTGPVTCQELAVSYYEEILEEQTGKSVHEQVWGKRVKGKNLMNRIQVHEVIEKFNQVAQASCLRLITTESKRSPQRKNNNSR